VCVAGSLDGVVGRLPLVHMFVLLPPAAWWVLVECLRVVVIMPCSFCYSDTHGFYFVGGELAASLNSGSLILFVTV
jgi:hypothetical protein